MQYTISDWPVRPMEFGSGEMLLDSADHIYQVKWDGVRCLAYNFPDGVRLWNRKLNERTLQYPEFVSELAALPDFTVLDGEIVAFGSGGRPDFPRVLIRDFARSPGKIANLVLSVPVHYMVFDILWTNGRALYPLPLAERLKILEGISFASGSIQKVESVPVHGKALFTAVEAEGMEGIVAKKTDSPYRIGERTSLWQKFKCFRDIEAVIGGYLQEGSGRIRSLLVGLPESDGIRYIGSAASGVTQKQWEALRLLFTRLAAPCPFVNPPVSGEARWISPDIPVSVRFLEYTPEGVMRAPSVKGFPGGLQ